MATIAEQLTSLANTKTAIKDAIVAKGVSVADTDPFRSYADKIGQIESGGGGAPATKFGASVDTWIGDVDENGVLSKPTTQTELDFTGVKEIGSNVLEYSFYKHNNIQSVDFGSVTTISSYGLDYAFYNCPIIDLNLSSLKTVGDYGMRQTFYSSYIENADLSSLTTVGNYGLNYSFSGNTRLKNVNLSSLTTVGNSGVYQTFYGDTSLESVNLSSLTTLGTYGLYRAFYNSKITTMHFPMLVNLQSTSLTNAFEECKYLTEIHFRADMQATIEALSGYSSKFGATNATIYFDL